MFSAYPDGWPGLGLLLLRAAAGGELVVQGIACARYKQDPGSIFWALACLMTVLGILLLVGLLTRFATVVVAVGAVSSILGWFPSPNIEPFDNAMTSTLVLMIAAAIISLGPGAFSIDGRLFGRREVTIHDHSHDEGI